jgi:hypothetical protein
MVRKAKERSTCTSRGSLANRRRRRDTLLPATVEAWRIDDDGAVLFDVLLVDCVALVAWVNRIIEIDASENCEHISLQERHEKLECKQ